MTTKVGAPESLFLTSFDRARIRPPSLLLFRGRLFGMIRCAAIFGLASAISLASPKTRIAWPRSTATQSTSGLFSYCASSGCPGRYSASPHM